MIGSSDYIAGQGGTISTMFRCLFGGYLYYTLATTALADDRVPQGFDVARELCARCHVIGEYNRLGGIGNAPSFQWMVKADDWRERFGSFYARRPYPVFVRMAGYDKWSEADPYYPPFTITVEEIKLISIYAATLVLPGEK